MCGGVVRVSVVCVVRVCVVNKLYQFTWGRISHRTPVIPREKSPWAIKNKHIFGIASYEWPNRQGTRG